MTLQQTLKWTARLYLQAAGTLAVGVVLILVISHLP